MRDATMETLKKMTVAIKRAKSRVRGCASALAIQSLLEYLGNHTWKEIHAYELDLSGFRMDKQSGRVALDSDLAPSSSRAPCGFSEDLAQHTHVSSRLRCLSQATGTFVLRPSRKTRVPTALRTQQVNHCMHFIV
jgi:hypothetical protein